MRQLKNYEEVKNYVLANAMQDGTFSQSYKMIAKNTHSGNLATVRNNLLRMISDGLLEVKRESKRGMGGSGVYRVINPNDDFIEIQFEGVTLLIRKTSNGHAISKKQLAQCTLEREEILDKIIKSNKELFDGNIIELSGEEWITRKGILNYLIKLNLDNVLPLKRQTLAEFQSQVVNKMIEVATGHISWGEDERYHILHNLQSLTEIKPEDIKKVFSDIETEINTMCDDFQSKLNQCHSKLGNQTKEISRVSNLLEVEKRKVQGYITEKNHLQEQLLSRQ